MTGIGVIFKMNNSGKCDIDEAMRFPGRLFATGTPPYGYRRVTLDANNGFVYCVAGMGVLVDPAVGDNVPTLFRGRPGNGWSVCVGPGFVCDYFTAFPFFLVSEVDPHSALCVAGQTSGMCGPPTLTVSSSIRHLQSGAANPVPGFRCAVSS